MNSGSASAASEIAGRHLLQLGKRIQVHAVLEDAVVEVRAGRRTRLADAPDDLALLDSGPRADAGRERRQVQVRRLVAAGVTDADHSSGLTRPLGGFDDAGSDRVHGRAERRAVVDAQMRTTDAEHRMKAIGREPRRHARIERQGRLQELPFQRPPLFVVPAARAVGPDKGNCGDTSAPAS